jgi:SET domain-containing protein
MRIIRNKMAEARRAADKEEANMMSKKTPMKEWDGEKVTYARNVDNATRGGIDI